MNLGPHLDQYRGAAELLEAEFLRTMRGIPAHHLTKALTYLTPGINWAGCSKAHMAEDWAKARVLPKWAANNPQLNRVQLRQLAALAIARANGDVNWRKAA